MEPLPKITQIVRQERRKNRVSVFIDGEYAFGVEEEQIYAFRLHIGEEMTKERLFEIEQGALLTSAKAAAQRALSRSMRSENEIRKRLIEKEFPQHIIDQTLSWLREYRFVDDAEFARSYIRTRQALRPASRMKLAADLAKKGIPSDIIRKTLDELTGFAEDRSTAEKLAKSYISKNRALDKKTMQRRLAGYLQRRGFSLSIVFSILEQATGYREDPE